MRRKYVWLIYRQFEDIQECFFHHNHRKLVGPARHSGNHTSDPAWGPSLHPSLTSMSSQPKARGLPHTPSRISSPPQLPTWLQRTRTMAVAGAPAAARRGASSLTIGNWSTQHDIQAITHRTPLGSITHEHELPTLSQRPPSDLTLPPRSSSPPQLRTWSQRTR